MSTLTLSSFTPPNCQLTGSTATLRIYYQQDFVASDGTLVIGGAVGSQNFYDEVACTIAGDVLTVPQFDLITTDDIQSPLNLDVPVTAVLYQGTTQIATIFSNYIIPVSLAPSCNIAALAIFNAALVITYPPSYFLTREQIVDLIGDTAPTAVDASTSVKGVTKLSVAAASATNPIAVGDNDPRVPTSLTAAGQALLDDATADAQLTTLGVTAAGKALLDDANAAAQLITLGLTATAAEINKLDGAGATVASGTQHAHVADPTGGATVDAESRTAINAILDALEAFGINAP